MTKDRPGFHTLFAQIPDAVYAALEADALARGISVARLLTDMLAKKYKIPPDQVPLPKKAGPKPRPKA